MYLDRLTESESFFVRERAIAEILAVLPHQPNERNDA
jgi:hypothetical protein